MQLSESLELRDADGGERVYACSACGHQLGPSDRNYKFGCLVEESAVTEVNPHLPDPALYVEADIVFRRFYCPGCAVQIETELARAGDEPLWDIEIR